MKAHYTHAIPIFTCALLSVLVSCGPSDEEKRAVLDEKINRLDSEMSELDSQIDSRMINSSWKSVAAGAIIGGSIAVGAAPAATIGGALFEDALKDANEADEAIEEYRAKEREREALIKERDAFSK